jgi:beta-N-acetylhexosaminidase
LLAAVKSGRVSEARLDASVLRILEAKAKRGILPGFAAPPAVANATVLNSPEHRALALEVARKAVTLQRDVGSLLPLDVSSRVLVIVPDAPTRSDVQDDQLASSLLDAVRRFAPSAFTGSPNAATNADIIVLGTFDLAQRSSQQALARALVKTGKPVIGVSLRGPYDADAAPEIGTFLTVYGDRPVHLQAASEALFGRLTPTGRVP